MVFVIDCTARAGVRLPGRGGNVGEAIGYNRWIMAFKKIITRFAPSPTGALHVGGARTALFNWAFARQHGGEFILRIEDTDTARSTAAAARGIIADMRWLGLDWDAGPALPSDYESAISEGYDPYADQCGDAGPYFQSQRQAIYREHLDRLRETGRVYDDEGAVRFSMPKEGISVEDLVLGTVRVGADDPQMQDFVIFKSAREGAEAGPTFHFANVVDDHAMGVTHVIRGQEHLNNTIKHAALQEALGFDRPAYAHIPLIFNPDGSKMSKRDKAKAARSAAKAADLAGLPGVEPGRFEQFLDKQSDEVEVAAAIAEQLGLALPEIDVSDFRGSGYLPEVLVNYLALLGWNPGGDLERFGADPLGFVRERFGLERVQKGAAKFDRNKLYSFNHQAIMEMEPGSFRERLRAHLRSWHGEFRALCEDDKRFALFAQAYQPRTHVLSEAAELGAFFVKPVKGYEQKAVTKHLLGKDRQGEQLLRELRGELEKVEGGEGFGGRAHEAMAALAETKGVKIGAIAQGLRVAVSGRAVTPPVDVTLEILGKDEALERIDACLLHVGE